MTVEQFENLLSDFGDNLNDQLGLDLLFIGGEIVNQLKQLVPVDTGALQSSIQAVMQDNKLKIEMLRYGMFQNFGVEGTDSNPGAFGVPAGIEPEHSGTYKFKSLAIGGELPFGVRVSIARYGLKPQTFFNVENLSVQIATRMDEIIQSRLNNI